MTTNPTARRDRIRRVAFYTATKTPLWLGLVRSVRLTQANPRALHPTR